MEIWHYLLIVIGAIALIIFIYFIIKKEVKEITKVHHLKLFKKGFTEMPALPFSLIETGETVVKLGLRADENKMAKNGLNNEYTLNGETKSGYTFMYDKASHDPAKEERKKLLKKTKHLREEDFLDHNKLDEHFKDASPPLKGHPDDKYTNYFLETPEQFTMSWTNYYGIYNSALPKAKEYASILTDPNAASEQFWPMIAENGFAYNLLFLQMVKEEDIKEIQTNFKDEWNDLLMPAFRNNSLYSIDLRIFSQWGPQKVSGFDRWTPGAWILLQQDKSTKKLTPIALRIESPTDYEIYTRNKTTDSAWIYALMAARTAVTVYGIWLGHVYHWHIVTAAMQMTMFNTFSKEHAIRKFMDPQSKSLIGFNYTLLLLWSKIGPPTSFSTPNLFLELTNSFATNRNFSDDDPNVAIRKLGLKVENFSIDKDWDQYPLVAYLKYFWKISGDLADDFVRNTYKTEKAFSDDTQLKDWMDASSDPKEGNIRGLPEMTSREDLKKVLHSLVYRVVAHGNSRMLKSLDPALCFVANFPPCLQSAEMLKPEENKSLKDLLRHLPNTGTIGAMMTFYYIFTYSAPYNPLIPKFGFDSDLYFDDPDDPRNKALIKFRHRVADFIKEYEKDAPLIHQWPASIET